MIKISSMCVAATLAFSVASGGAFAASAMKANDAGTKMPKGTMTYEQMSMMSPADQMSVYNHMGKKNQMMMMKKCPGNAGEGKAAAFCHKM